MKKYPGLGLILLILIFVIASFFECPVKKKNKNVINNNNSITIINSDSIQIGSPGDYEIIYELKFNSPSPDSLWKQLLKRLKLRKLEKELFKNVSKI